MHFIHLKNAHRLKFQSVLLSLVYASFSIGPICKYWISINKDTSKLNPNKAGLFEGSFFNLIPSLYPPYNLHISRINKNANIICYMWSHLFFCNREMSKKLDEWKESQWKEGENLHIFWATLGISMKLSEKISKKKGFRPLPRKYIFGETTGGESNGFNSLFRVKLIKKMCVIVKTMCFYSFTVQAKSRYKI